MNFGNQENKFGGNDHAPALPVRYAVAEHEAPDPDYEGDDRKFPQVNKRNGQELQGINNLQNGACGLILQKIEGRGFIFYKRYLNIQQQQGTQTEDDEKKLFVGTEE